MSARQNNDKSIEIKINNMLKNQPEIIKMYIKTKHNMTPLSRYSYLRYVAGFNEYVKSKGISLEEVKPMYINEYISDLTKDNGTDIINAKLSAIISFYSFLVENEIIEKNPCVKIKKLKKTKEKEVVYLTEDEIQKVKNYIILKSTNKGYTKRDYCLFILGIRLGLRISAILNIDIEDIDFENKYVTVTEKGNITKNIVLGDDTMRIIKDWMKDREALVSKDEHALFVSSKKNRMSVRAAERMIDGCGEYIGKKITPHKLRSTCAMTLYDKTGDIYLVQQQLGHKNIKNTMIYAKASDKKMKQVANMMDKI